MIRGSTHERVRIGRDRAFHRLASELSDEREAWVFIGAADGAWKQGDKGWAAEFEHDAT